MKAGCTILLCYNLTNEPIENWIRTYQDLVRNIILDNHAPWRANYYQYIIVKYYQCSKTDMIVRSFAGLAHCVKRVRKGRPQKWPGH